MRLTDEELAEFAKMYDGIREQSAVRRVIDELIERRAAELTAEDVEALEFARTALIALTDAHHDPANRAIEVLTRLTRAGRKA